VSRAVAVAELCFAVLISCAAHDGFLPVVFALTLVFFTRGDVATIVVAEAELRCSAHLRVLHSRFELGW